MDVIEQDAINDPTWQQPPIEAHDHTHEEVKSFVAMPRQDQGLIDRFVSMFKSLLKPGVHVTRKDDDLRYMFIITSNSYRDRDDETITSAALKAYEESCYPTDDGQFVCDNPLLWWHDDDIVMGDIVAVNYSEPFLIEIAKERPDIVSKVLFDFAEQNGDAGAASHRFGYLDRDRDEDGHYQHIFKQETSFLPDRQLAANGKTYAGVLMASPQSDKRFDEIFEAATGVKGAAAMLHAKSGDIQKLLAERGEISKALNQKAAPPIPPKAAVEADAVEDEMEMEVEEETKGDIGSYASVVNQIYQLVMELVDAQSGGIQNEMAMAKSIKSLEAAIAETNTAQKARETSLEQRITLLEKRLSMTPRSASMELGTTDPELAKQLVGEAIDGAIKAKSEEALGHDPLWGPLKPLPK